MTSDYINNQEAREREQAIDADQNKWLGPFAAGIGTIALGSVLLKKRIAEGGDVLSNLFNFLGVPKGIGLSTDMATNVGKSAARGRTAGIRGILSSTFDIKKNAVNLGPIDIIDDLRNSAELIGASSQRSVADFIKDKTTEYVHREMATGGNNTGYFTQGLERVTFGRVLQDQKNWSRILGNEQFSVIQKAQSLGLITENMTLDKKLFINKASNEVLDLRLRNLTSKVHRVNKGGKEVFERRAKFDMFGQAEVLSSLSGLKHKGIGVIGPGDGYGGTRLFIGGNVYGFEKIKGTANLRGKLLGQNRILRKTGGALETIAASRQGRIRHRLPVRTGTLGKAISWAENTFGIGPGFSSRPSLINRLVIDPFRRHRALAKGEGVIYKHPYKATYGPTKLLDASLGAEVPEIGGVSGSFIPVAGGDRALGMAQLKGRTLGVIPNRVGILFDVTDQHSIVKRRPYKEYAGGARTNLTGGDMIVPPKTGGYEITGRVIPSSSPVNHMTDVIQDDLTAVGFPSVSKRYKYYDVEKTKIAGRRSGLLTGIKDFAAYSLYRVNSLASETMLGIAFAPSHKISTNLARLGGIAFAYEGLRQGGLYADYVTEKVTGVSPIKAVAGAYANTRLLQQKLREVTGIQQGANFLETYFPGSMDSEGSMIARGILAPMYAASYFLGKGKFGKAAIGAAGTYGVVGGPGIGQTSEELGREYSGDKKVAVRQGAFWSLGYLPFLGGKPTRYEQSWYAKLQSGYRNKSIYGSDEEYWSYHANVFGIPLPTPSNLLGLNNILNPYRLEEINYHDRPYPQTSNALQNLPIIGPAVAATLGELMKPTQYRSGETMPMLKAGLADPGLTPSTARMMGIPSMNATSPEVQDPNDALSVLARQTNIITEPLGVYKFAMEFFGISTKPEVGTSYATSGTIGDPGRALYDSGVGGAFGQTEFIRRFMLSDYSSKYRRSAMINNIRNTMPEWMPGSYSAIDPDYFIDFTQGDPYAKIEDGEARLPGKGYEALNELHSGRKGEYSDVDRFLILSDVAPYSTAYKQYEARVDSMGLEGRWAQKVEEAKQNRKNVLGVDDRYKRYEEDIIALNMNIIEKSIYKPFRKAYDFITHDVLAEIPYIGTKLFPFRSPYEQYRKLNVEGSEYASWDRPYEDILRPMGYDMALEDPITAAGKGATLGFLISGPMRWFTPFKSMVTSPGHSVNALVVGGGAVLGAGLSTSRIAAGYDQDMIPHHKEVESQAINYMDKVAYIKGRMIENAGGSSIFANRTMVGARTQADYRSALPNSSERRYFDYFTSQESGDVRAQILQGMPSYMAQGLEMSWNQKFNSRPESDAETLAFVNSNELPDSDWMGWRPDVSAQAAKLKLIQHGVNGISDNIHRFGFYESHEIDMSTRLKAMQTQEMTFTQSPMYSSFDQFINSQSKSVKNSVLQAQSFSTPYRNRRELTIKQDRDQESLQTLREAFR